MEALKEIIHRDEIHGDVGYDPLAVALLDTGVLQRLGRVYQLGYGHLVYRGGTHTRLSHSMGAYHTAAVLVDALFENYGRRRGHPSGAIPPGEFLPRAPRRSGSASPDPAALEFDTGPGAPAGDGELGDRWTVLRHLVCWAALLHDIGHVPMGHTLEDEFENVYTKHDKLESPRLSHLWVSSSTGGTPEIRQVFEHRNLYPEAFGRLGIDSPEDVWGAVFLICMFKDQIDDDPDGKTFRDLLAEGKASEDRGAVAVADALDGLFGRLSPDLFSPYMADLVANTISADYLDYLRRDPHNLGLDVLRDDRVVSRFWIGRDVREQPRMALSLVNGRGKPRLDTCTGVIELVRQRYRFAEIVYYHKTKVAASAMLAKVFDLVGKPDERPGARAVPTLADVENRVDALLALDRRKQTQALQRLHEQCTPTSLLDPEIGDESLPLFLAGRAWQKLSESVKAEDRDQAVKGLQTISLLDSLVRRKLYKVALMVDAEQYKQLSSRSDTPDEIVERSLVSFIEDLRTREDARTAIESSMVEATEGWPSNSVLLYVPPRKSQAKGIETGALADGRVVTLGSHPVAKPQVDDLNKRYQQLWRLIVLVHPDQVTDVIGLSAAVDALMADRFPESDLDDGIIESTLKRSCWFPYVRRRDRDAARRYRRLLEGVAEEDVDWLMVDRFDSGLSGGASDDERAAGAALLQRLERRIGAEKALSTVRARYARPGLLSERVDELVALDGGVASREGEADEEAAILVQRRVLDSIAEELT